MALNKKRYALYTCNASNHKMFITKDRHGKPFFKKIDAISYAEGISGTSVYLITMSKEMEFLK